MAAFPRRTARDDHGAATSGEGAGDVRIGDRVETQLDQVGVCHLVALLTELGRRRRGHGYTKARFCHRPKTKSPFNRWAEEALGFPFLAVAGQARADASS